MEQFVQSWYKSGSKVPDLNHTRQEYSREGTKERGREWVCGDELEAWHTKKAKPCLASDIVHLDACSHSCLHQFRS